MFKVALLHIIYLIEFHIKELITYYILWPMY